MSFRVAICQTDIAWRSAETNLQRIEDRLAGIDAELVVLPEMFATGFVTDSAEVAEPMSGRIVGRMQRWAADYGMAVAGSVAVATRQGIRNRMVLAEPSGRIDFFDKRHLFTPGGEDRLFSRGSERTILACRGVRLMPVVCYDLRFPVWCRCRNDYDLLVCVASWPASRRNVWQTLLRARAIENQCYAVGVNRVGEDPRNRYAGDSAVIGFRGDTLAEAGDAEGIVTVALDFEAQQAFRTKFPVWRDADPFSIECGEEEQKPKTSGGGETRS